LLRVSLGMAGSASTSLIDASRTRRLGWWAVYLADRFFSL
jgi:hypothetical protein